MSEKFIEIDGPPGIDPRAYRTRKLLAEALMSLGAEAPIADFGIGELVEEAGVSRSTFYQHYASKDDFLIRSFVNMIGATEDAHARLEPDREDLLPSRSLFHHVAGAPDFVRNTVAADHFPHLMAAGETKLRAIVETNLARLQPSWSAQKRRETAIYVAGGFIGLLRWWMQSGLARTPSEMQEAFARLSKAALAD